MSAPTLAARYRNACAALGLPVWRPGMRVWRDHGRLGSRFDEVTDVAGLERSGAEPDFNDPATIGCLLAAVRQAWVAPTLFVRPTASGWTVMRGSGAGMGKLSDGPREADALVGALEEAAQRPASSR